MFFSPSVYSSQLCLLQITSGIHKYLCLGDRSSINDVFTYISIKPLYSTENSRWPPFLKWNIRFFFINLNVSAATQPVCALVKQVQWHVLNCFGRINRSSCLGDLHIEMAPIRSRGPLVTDYLVIL